MNETKKTLTMEFIESIMDEKYTLVWVDYRESFDENRDLLQKCLEKQGCEDLWSKVEDWYDDAEEQATQEIIKGLKSHCIDFYDFEEDEVEENANENETADNNDDTSETAEENDETRSHECRKTERILFPPFRKRGSAGEMVPGRSIGPLSGQRASPSAEERLQFPDSAVS